ncbi:LLM class flavin-dependent oxidoreductase [Streptomyces javensis]|uniref:LLM class flavin-dependent oxidoreductase n=1 Tax=Streptomyces javensis TaxID=114698 RepID=UPI0033F36701
MDTDTVPWQLRAMLDPFVALSLVASVTERVLLGTSTRVAPWVSPLLLARSLTGVDVVSGGRLITGLGTGWSPEEYQGVGVPWQERGARLDECLDVLEAVWTTEPVARHEGRHYPSPPPASGPSRSSAPAPDLPVRLRLGLPTLGGPPRGRRTSRRGARPGLRIRPRRRDEPAAAGSPQPREAEGRVPAGIDAILRVNPTTESTVSEMAGIILRTGDETDVDHVFVDFVHLVLQSGFVITRQGRLGMGTATA